MNGKRNRHSREFKEETVKLITEHGYTVYLQLKWHKQVPEIK